MGFSRDLLADHEELVFELRPHWIALAPSFLWTLVAIVLGTTAYFFADSRFGEPTIVDNVVVAIIVVAWLFLAVPPFVTWRYTLFVLTTDRLITRSGFFAKSSKEIPLERINDVAFNQSFVERLLQSGDLLIESAGERGHSRITNVRDPEKVQLRIFQESEKNQNRMFGVDRARPQASIPEQIEALARLKDQGVISESEFQAKKHELLDRL